MRRLAVILTAAATTAAGLAAVPAHAATLPSAPTSGYSIDTGPGPQGGWGSRFVTAAGAASGYSTGSGAFAVQGSNPAGTSARTFVSPPTGQSFAVGTYDINEEPTASEAGVTINGGAASECGVVTGTLTVHEVTLTSGQVTAFAGSVRGNCGNGQVFTQEIRWNATVPLVRLTAPVSTQTATEVVEVVISRPTTFGAAIGSGTDAKVRLASDTCSGKTFAAGTTCLLGIAATPDFFGPAQDLITLPDGGTGRKVPVTVVGYDTANGAYTPLAPARLLDTRNRTGVSTTTPVGAGRSIDLQVTSRGGVPASGVSAVVLNVTVAGPTSAGYVTVFPTGAARPTASSVNFNKGWTGANLITVKLGTGGKVRIYNQSGSTHVIADVVGYYHGATSAAASGYGGYSAVPPERMVDTRSGGGKLPGGYYLTTGYDFGSDYNGHIKAFAVNITVTQPTRAGFLTAWNGDDNAIPGTSTLNFTTGRTVPNMAVVPTSPCGPAVCPSDPSIPVMGVLNGSSGSAHVIVDIVGAYDDNTIDGMWRFHPLAGPTRIVNTKAAQGIPSALPAGSTTTVVAPETVRGYNAMALVTNTTANKPTSSTVLTLWNADIPRPGVSNLNPYAGQLVSNMTITEIGVDYEFAISNSSGTTDLVLDVAGTMDTYPAVADPGAGAALRADGLSALRERSAQRATRDPGAGAPALTGTPVVGVARHR